MNHVQAKVIVDAITSSPAESLFVRAVSWGESQYGTGWKPPGVGSHNWGAIIGKGDAGSFEYQDKLANGTVYTTDFAKYSSDTVGAKALAHLLLKPNVTDALSNGDVTEAVAAQINENHYTGNPPATPADKYEARVRKSIDLIIAATGEDNPFDLDEPKLGSDSPPSPSAC